MFLTIVVTTGDCAQGMVLCGSGECINEDYVCDHGYDCSDKSDDPSYCGEYLLKLI